MDDKTFMVLNLHGLTERIYQEVKAKTENRVKIKKVFIAEDDPFFRGQLIAFLRSKSIEATAFEDGQALKDHLANSTSLEDHGAIISDIEMPRLDGIGLIRWARGFELTRNIPVLVVTSLTNKEVVRLAMNAGANSFIPKMHHSQILTELNRIEAGLESSGAETLKSIDEKVGSNRVVTFSVAQENFAMPMHVLKEVSKTSPYLDVPGYPAWINKVTAFRGKMIPVIDLQILFGSHDANATNATYQAIVDVDGQVFAILMSSIGEVLQQSQLIAGEGITKVGHNQTAMAKFVRGVYQREGSVLTYLEPASLATLISSTKEALNKEGVAA
jgi:chemotaxis signal transduction protein